MKEVTEAMGGDTGKISRNMITLALEAVGEMLLSIYSGNALECLIQESTRSNICF